MIHSRFLLALAVLAGGVAVQLPATADQDVRGRIDLGLPGGDELARRAWLASQGTVNGGTGYVFALDPRTTGGRFRLNAPDAEADLDLTLYSDIIGGTVCARFDGPDDERGDLCGTYAIVSAKQGALVEYIYRGIEPSFSITCEEATLSVGVTALTGCTIASHANFAGFVSIVCEAPTGLGCGVALPGCEPGSGGPGCPPPIGDERTVFLPRNGASSFVLQASADDSTPLGAYVIGVIGRTAHVTRRFPAHVEVVPPPPFAIACSWGDTGDPIDRFPPLVPGTTDRDIFCHVEASPTYGIPVIEVSCMAQEPILCDLDRSEVGPYEDFAVSLTAEADALLGEYDVTLQGADGFQIVDRTLPVDIGDYAITCHPATLHPLNNDEATALCSIQTVGAFDEPVQWLCEQTDPVGCDIGPSDPDQLDRERVLTVFAHGEVGQTANVRVVAMVPRLDPTPSRPFEVAVTIH